MAQLLLLTHALQPSAEVLPALGLLLHQVRVAPAEASALIDAPAADVVLVDGRRDLPARPQPVPADPGHRRRLPGPARHDRGRARRGHRRLGHRRRAARHRRAGRGRGPAAAGDRAARRPSAPATSTPPTRSAPATSRSTRPPTPHGSAAASLDLTFKEFELLKYLAQHPGRVFTRAQLLQEVWGYDYFGGTRTVDVHVRRLRAKLGAEHEASIGTVRNVGYRFVLPARDERAEERADARG